MLIKLLINSLKAEVNINHKVSLTFGQKRTSSVSNIPQVVMAASTAPSSMLQD